MNISTQSIDFVFADNLDLLASGDFPLDVMVPGRIVTLTKEGYEFSFEIVEIAGRQIKVWPASLGMVH